ncbi:extracellular solute-binding protein [Pelomonas sp. V22]|uniref:ABC transporter substrate-binding protein n=1 Tax=Pelomonas sp. V22 TaxID=2822139 RepID=UPI0024A970D6|nr:extracellular solute-binding protein [Pelomonas sp. V22]MDI4632409.1 extracellular solute-binding protein [Pelomonas sp. V22]
MALRLSLSAGLAAGGSAMAAPPARRLEFWTMQLSPHLDDYVLGLIQRFEGLNPGVTVKWVDLPWAETERKLLGAIAARSSPDVVNLNPQFSAKLAEFGALADPEEHLSPGERADYLPAAWEANRLAGRCFALPWYLSTNLTLINKRLLDGKLPVSHLDLLAAAPSIKRQRGAFAYFPALDGSSPLETLVAMGADLLDARACGAGFINSRGAEVFDFYRRLYAEGLTPRNVVSEGHRKAVEMFLSGHVAVVSSGMQFLSFIRNNNPQVYRDIVAAPQMRAAGRKPGIAAMNLTVPAASRNRDLAFRFARFVTAPEQQLAFARRVPVLPSTRASYADPLFTAADASDLLGQARALSAQHVQAGEVQVPPLRNYNKLRSNYARNLQAVMLGRKGRDEALADVGRQWSQLLGCQA